MGLDYSDVRPSYSQSQFNKPRTPRRIFKNSGHGWNLPEQLAGSSSRSGSNRGAAVEANAIGEQKTKRTTSGSRVEVDAIGVQQPKQTQSGSSEMDAIESSSSAQRAIRHQITHVGERGGSS